MSQAPLLPRIASGDQTAVADCLTRYGGLVWSLARRFSASQQAAEDAVQEIFLSVWKAAPRYDASLSAETTFVAMIARRKLIDLNRRKKHTQANDFPLEEVSSTFRSASKIAEISDEAEKAHHLLEQLPADQQQVIKLSVYNGMSHSKIAETTGLSLGTVKTHIRRGLLRLRETLYGNAGVTGGQLS
jgi:RNA polymerase sigma-70 factor (ECF subfamily)